LAEYITVARKNMLVRGLIAESGEGWIAVQDERPLLQFYANSLDGLVSDSPPPSDAADAKS
jgi:hypothetical protein